ncbi:MAG: flgG 2 [Firmicutes bacterium]|nr:flgG 2 [Bacillota bacterium]
MIRGIYTAASGMVAETIRTDTTANNLANASTTGYKKDVAVSREFSGLLLQRMNDGQNATIGTLGTGSTIDAVLTQQTAGTLRPTGNPLDMAIDGRGFFTVQTPNGLRYTRNGSFTRNAADQLVTSDGYPVVGQTGAISLNGVIGSNITITADGRIYNGPEELDRLQLADFTDPSRLVKEGANLFAAGDAVPEKTVMGKVSQATLEMSNVNIVAEMVNLISGYRSYEINSKAVQAQDGMLDKAVNEVGRV